MRRLTKEDLNTKIKDLTNGYNNLYLYYWGYDYNFDKNELLETNNLCLASSYDLDDISYNIQGDVAGVANICEELNNEVEELTLDELLTRAIDKDKKMSEGNN